MTDKKDTKSAFAFKTSYTAKLNENAINDYVDFLKSIGVPSKSKMAIVADVVHSYPFINDNHMGFTSDVIRSSYMSFLNSPININHERRTICGTIVKVDLIENENTPLTIRIVAVLYKDILLQWGIENLMNEDWSMECLFNNVLFSINNKIYRPEEIPVINNQLDDILDGKPVYDEVGHRVDVLLGGDQNVEFNGCGLIIYGRGADSLAETHLQVASKKQNNSDIKEGEKMFKQFETEKEWNEAIASIKQEVETVSNQAIAAKQTDMEKMQKTIDDMKQQMKDMQTMIDGMKGKAEQAEASLATEKTRADAAESKLQEQATAQLVSERKQSLASIGYPEDLITKKADFLAKASKEDFDNLVEEVKVLFASASKTMEAKAEKLGLKEAYASISLTGKTSEETVDETKKTETVNLFA